ncbi:hypothetical protein SAMN06297422_10673 [Lachnospiraceae bacterium]|nr:hypothetical protein SAMN06297422_10673 [Lachnospiraceae bacterium]
MIFEVLSIILLILLCSISIYTDYKKGLIYNRVLLIIGIPLIVLNFVSIFIDRPEKLTKYILLVLISIGISIFLYMFKIWAGGDFKLFSVIILGMPYSYVLKSINDLSYIFIVLLFSFSFGYIFLIGESLVHMIKEKRSAKSIVLSSLVEFKNYLKIYVCILFFNHITDTIYSALFQNQIPVWVQVGLNIGFIVLIRKLDILKYKSVMITFLLADLILGAFSFEMFSDYRVYVTWGIIIFILMTRAMVQKYNYKEIKYTELKKGMILSTVSSISLANEKKLKFCRLSDESLDSRLAQEEVEDILIFCSQNEKYNNITIVKKIPFALFLSLATLIVIIGGNYFEFESF